MQMRQPTQMASAHGVMITRTYLCTNTETSKRTCPDVFLSNHKDGTSHISDRQRVRRFEINGLELGW